MIKSKKYLFIIRDLMALGRPHKQCSSEAIMFEGKPCITTEDTWTAFHSTFSSALHRDTYPMHLGQALSPKSKRPWVNISKHELCEVLVGCSGRSAPGPDHVTWALVKKFPLYPPIFEVFHWLCNLCFCM